LLSQSISRACPQTTSMLDAAAAAKNVNTFSPLAVLMKNMEN
jgi:hypothetical protein